MIGSGVPLLGGVGRSGVGPGFVSVLAETVSGLGPGVSLPEKN